MKKLLFGISLLIGIALSIGVPYYFYQVNELALYIAFISLSTSTITAVYSILALPDPNKAKRQELYGQLKSDLTTLIDELKLWNYQIVNFTLWGAIQQDDRVHLFDEKLIKKLDSFSDGIKKYSSAIEKLNFHILPELTRDVADEVFNKSPDTANLVHISLLIGIKNRSPKSIPITIYDHLKKKHSLSNVADYVKKELNYEKEDITHFQWQLLRTTQ